ncbi:MAG: flagellar biosynthesis protein FlgA [Actinomycetales bacterium]|nr:flagellar biosynthesis protein FlgA [Actinomycetales bacterium]
MRARLRRWASAALLALAGWLAVSALTPRPMDPGVEVFVAARELAVGARLTAADVGLARMPSGSVPGSALRPPLSPEGRVLAAPIGAGEPFTTHRLQGPGLLTGYPTGSLAVSVPLADPGLLAALRPGDRIHVFAVGTGAAVAQGIVLVCQSPEPGGDLMGTGGGAGRLVAAVDPAQAAAIAAASGPSGLGAGFVVALAAQP